MAKLLVNDEWFVSIDPSALYEKEFESILLSRSEALFPGFVPAVFKKTVSSETESARADYALIERHYRAWWVVEVELSHHSLTGHILPQVQTLLDARYGHDEATYLASRNPALDRGRLAEMMKGRAPQVLVVVDRPQPTWVGALAGRGAELCVFEIFVSDRHRFVYRINGYTPLFDVEHLTRCWIDPAIPFMVRLESPAALPAPLDGTLRMSFDGRLTEWTRIDSQGAAWLTAKQRNPLVRGKTYEIISAPDGRLILRKKGA